MLTSQFYKWLLWCMASLLLVAASYFWHAQSEHSGANPTPFIILALVLFIQSYRYTHAFRRRNNLASLIKRNRDVLVFYHPSSLPFSQPVYTESIEISRLSVISVFNNGVSIIIDGNGRGYDFMLHWQKQKIAEHIKTLLKPEELKQLTLQLV